MPAKERIQYVAGRLDEALVRPVTGETWPGLAAAAFGRFHDIDLMDAFAEKALETFEDSERHDRLAVSPDDPRVAIWFVAWSGTHREVQAERYGEYLTKLLAAAFRLVEQGLELAGFLELDGYIRGHPSPEPSGADSIEIDVELSFLPGSLLGYPSDRPNPLPPVFQINPDLCTPDEVARLRQATA